MAVMEAAIIDRIRADAAISAVVSGRVYPLKRLQGSAYPAIVVNRIAGGPLYDDDGEAGLQNAAVQVDSYGRTYGEAKDLAQLVRTCLSAFRGTHGGIAFSYVRLEAERDLAEDGANAAEYPARVSMDFVVWTRG